MVCKLSCNVNNLGAFDRFDRAVAVSRPASSWDSCSAQRPAGVDLRALYHRLQLPPADRPGVTIIFSFGLLAKVVLARLIVFFIVFFNTFQGACGVDPDLIHSAR